MGGKDGVKSLVKAPERAAGWGEWGSDDCTRFFPVELFRRNKAIALSFQHFEAELFYR